jgi:hypothetical protein
VLPAVPIAEVSLYSVVLFVHVAAAVAAFGVLFAYPILLAVARRGGPRDLAFYHRAQGAVGQWLITPAATVILLAGIYLAADGPFDFGEPFVGAGILIILVILGLSGAFFAPRERVLAEIAERDATGAAPGEGGVPSPDYERQARAVRTAHYAMSALVVLAVFLMVTKPGT